MLKKLEQELSSLCDGSLHLADHFDMVAGTCAGGMIALTNAHRRLPLDTVSDFFASGAAFQDTGMTLLPNGSWDCYEDLPILDHSWNGF